MVHFTNTFNRGQNEIEQQTLQMDLCGNKEEEEDARLTPPEYVEVIKTLQKLKNWKAPGKDIITAQLIKKHEI